MTLNITKKKIEKVLELFNHPQTRKIRKNRGKKRRRNNKSFNRKNGRKNLATSTLKKRGGHAGHPILNGGQVGVVLGGQVGGVGEIITKLFSSKNKEKTERLKKYIREKKDENKKNQFVVNLINKLNDKKKEEFDGINDVNSIKDSDFSIDFDYVNVSDSGVTVNNDLVDDLADEVSQEKSKKVITLGDLKGIDIDKFLEGEIDENRREDDGDEDRPNTEEQQQEDKSTKEATKPPTKSESKEIDTSEMLKVALASNYFTQYGILSGMLKMNQEKDNKKFDVMNFVQNPKLYAEFCNKMGFQFAEMKEEKEENDVKDTVVANEDANTQNNNETSKKSDANSEEKKEE